MALTYEDFKTYPVQISGIKEAYNEKITAIENFVISDMEYTGDDSEINAILIYFVYWYLVKDGATTVTAETGENVSLKKYTSSASLKMMNAWNIGVEKLIDICNANGETVNAKYLRTVNIFGI